MCSGSMPAFGLAPHFLSFTSTRNYRLSPRRCGPRNQNERVQRIGPARHLDICMGAAAVDSGARHLCLGVSSRRALQRRNAPLPCRTDGRPIPLAGPPPSYRCLRGLVPAQDCFCRCTCVDAGIRGQRIVSRRCRAEFCATVASIVRPSPEEVGPSLSNVGPQHLFQSDLT